MRNLYLVRHGKPQYPDEHSYCVGQTDFSLSMLGHLQAVLLNEELSDKISGVYCSPLLRAVETAGHMAPELPHIIVSDLSERNLGEWDGLSFDEIRQRWPDIYKARGNNPDHPIPGAETPAASGFRFSQAVHKILCASEGDIAVVAHKLQVHLKMYFQLLPTYIMSGCGLFYFLFSSFHTTFLLILYQVVA